ncbi:neurotrophin-4 [Nerophis ophidion]|uniref:neurotrophin-4 n=1 Tax=Nerophis ophidion TaxID=159077 RepID=UPI002AE05FF0|nr:neurotrophin-4 [Nerophis ophidion]XP_061761608.1 neurotrophin-4 [Nerophis ophidion]
MHWLPLVAMVIASALPFPHKPLSRSAAAASVEPGFREDDDDMAATHSREHLRNLTALGLDPRVSLEVPEKKGLPKNRHQQDRFSLVDSFQDSRPTQASVVETQIGESPAAGPRSSRRGAPTVPSEQLRNGATPAEGTLRASPGTALDTVLEGDDMFLDAHPRVVFSPSGSPPEDPPLLLMLETGLLEEDSDEPEEPDELIEGHGDRAIDRGLRWANASGFTADAARPVRRDKRSHLMDRRRGEKSVCESESVWVTDKKTAVDSHGQTVTILQDIQTQTGPLKQYFYETRCRQAEQQQSAAGRPPGAKGPLSQPTGVAGAGCLGVDKKQWVSECKDKTSFVRALTKDANNRTGWRWIRINSSCVCVLLSRANQILGREVLARRGRG